MKILKLLLIILLIYGFLTFNYSVTKPIVHDFNLKSNKFYLYSSKHDDISTLSQATKKVQDKYTFLTNGGIFNPDFSASGLLVRNHKELYKLNNNDATGNFFLKPNGVFFIHKNKATILPSEKYKNLNLTPEHAIQSGPMLLIQGKIHPSFIKNSSSKYTRSGIGIKEEQIYFVFFNHLINLYDFALYFKEELKCHDALYLDGSISGIIDSENKINENRKFASIIVVSEI